MKKTIVYIDGYNLYYGLLKGTPYKWLDPVSFARALLRDEHEILAVKYFTANIKTYPHDQEAVERQNVYLQALTHLDKLHIVYGFYRKSNVLMPAINEKCKICDQLEGRCIRVVKLEEKKSDVNLAVSLMVDATQSGADCFAVVTGDSDQAGAIEAMRYHYGKTVLVFNPHVGESVHLKRAASYYRNIPRDLPARCQLPDTVPVGTHGNRIHRPPAWS